MARDYKECSAENRTFDIGNSFKLIHKVLDFVLNGGEMTLGHRRPNIYSPYISGEKRLLFNVSFRFGGVEAIRVMMVDI